MVFVEEQTPMSPSVVCTEKTGMKDCHLSQNTKLNEWRMARRLMVMPCCSQSDRLVASNAIASNETKLKSKTNTRQKLVVMNMNCKE